ncbi:MAG: TatD family hydrolase [Lentisphaeria bacterium]
MSIWEVKGSIAEQYWNQGRADFPVYDMHGHMGSHNKIFFAHCEADKMVKHLQRCGVKRLVFSHHHALFDPGFANQRVFEIARQYPDFLRMYVGVNPNYPDIIRRDLALYEKWLPTVIGFKFLSAYHGRKISDEAYRPVFEFAQEHALPILFHTWGGDACASPDMFMEKAAKYPRILFFLGHSMRPDWQGCRRVHQACPDNVYFELTSIPGCNRLIEELVDAVGSQRILFGTDLPWFDEYQAIGGVVSAKISDQDKRNILYQNVEKLNIKGF